ncbi:MAG: response regulator [Bacillota bacterium]
MIKAILVDDEQLAVELLTHYLKATGMVEIVASFTNSLKAHEAINAGLTADVAFLDIDMPGMTGLELAASIRDNMEIVFVTAYNNFAIEAFELNAISYLLKPVEIERLRNGLERLQRFLGKSPTPAASSQQPLHICVLGRVAYFSADSEKTIKWRTAKAEELLMYLLIKKSAAKWQLIETIFPDYDEEKAEKLLHTSIYYIKQQLKKYCAKSGISFSGGNYKIEDGIIKSDYVKFSETIKSYSTITAVNYEAALALFATYSGDLFGDKEYNWSEDLRERLRGQYCSLAKALVDFQLSRQDEQAAIDTATRAADCTPSGETAIIILLKLFAKLGKHDELDNCYRRYCEYQAKEFDCDPPETVIECYELLQR